jgi:hypothetical protein
MPLSPQYRSVRQHVSKKASRTYGPSIRHDFAHDCKVELKNDVWLGLARTRFSNRAERKKSMRSGDNRYPKWLIKVPKNGTLDTVCA